MRCPDPYPPTPPGHDVHQDAPMPGKPAGGADVHQDRPAPSPAPDPPTPAAA